MPAHNNNNLKYQIPGNKSLRFYLRARQLVFCSCRRSQPCSVSADNFKRGRRLKRQKPEASRLFGREPCSRNLPVGPGRSVAGPSQAVSNRTQHRVFLGATLIRLISSKESGVSMVTHTCCPVCPGTWSYLRRTAVILEMPGRRGPRASRK